MAAGLQRDELLIGGRWRSTADTWTDVVCPSTEEVAARVRTATATDVDTSVAAARAALDAGAWSKAPMAERAAVIRRAAETLTPLAHEIGRVITTEMGSPFGEHQVILTVELMNSLAAAAETIELSAARPGRASWAIVDREPVGVVGALAPWNGPFHLAAQKTIAALLAGCSVVFRPDEQTPLDAFYLGEALMAAGLPEGVLSIVPGGRELGEYLVRHPGVDMVDFTGSSTAGRTVGAICGEELKRVHLELGGKSAALVLPDADVADAVPALSAVFMNTGQVCAALTRVLAPRSLYDEVVAGLIATADALPVGDPFVEGTMVGPLVSRRQLERVQQYIEVGEAEGAKLVCGGGRPENLERGFYFESTVFANVDNSMRVAQEEIFGPVVTVIPYDEVNDAIAMCNDSSYGLHGGVYTSDPARGVEVARRMITGTVSVNSCTINTDAPFGGRKASGIGRENGPEGIGAFLEYKTINVPEAVARAAIAPKEEEGNAHDHT